MDAQLQNQMHRMYPSRDWQNISGLWLGYISVIAPPGSKPSSSVDDFTEFEQIARSLSPSTRTDRRDVIGFRELVFHQALYLLHKASHAIGCAEMHASLGAHTWSLSEAYQGSFFAAKSICHLLGGILAEYDRHGILIDIWPGLNSGRSRMGLLTDTSIVFWYYKKNPGHIHMWQLFQHLVQVNKVDAWPAEYVSAITALAPQDFAKQRNVIHYGGVSWVFDDLFEFKPNSTYGVIKDRLISGFPYQEHSDFSFVLAQVIFRMALLLLYEIGSLTNITASEIEVFKKRLDGNFHPYYSKEFPL